MTEEINHFTETDLKDPAKMNLSLKGIKQFYVDVQKEEYKITTLVEIYKIIGVNQSVIFCNSFTQLQMIEEQLQSHNYPVDIIHETMTLHERNTVLQNFKYGLIRSIIVTDVIQEGFQCFYKNLEQVSLLINFDIPETNETYLERVGIHPECNKKGVVITFITTEERERINSIQLQYETKIVPLPTTFMDYL